MPLDKLIGQILGIGALVLLAIGCAIVLPVHGLRADRRGLREAAARDAGEPTEAGEQAEADRDPDLSRRAGQRHRRRRRQDAERQDGQRQVGDNQGGGWQTDIAASNGVIHVIDSVILPK